VVSTAREGRQTARGTGPSQCRGLCGCVLAVAQIAEDRKGPLFRSLDRERRLTKRRLHRLEVLAMIKRRARQASLPQTTCCHTFRATGITTYLQNGGTIEHAQQIANHESPRTTKLYDRTNDAISLDEIERILI
jgi:integrase/recombinase XerD